MMMCLSKKSNARNFSREDARLEQVTWGAGEDLSNLEGLREEALDLASARNRLLVLLTQLVHAQNGNDILQILVVLCRNEQVSEPRLQQLGRLPCSNHPVKRAPVRGLRLERSLWQLDGSSD